jgi:hypothetical protein
MTLPEKWLTVDPGEDCGWAIWSGTEFVEHGTDKMWEFADALWSEALSQLGAGAAAAISEPGIDHLQENLKDIKLVVVENWTLYPEVARSGGLDWDECRTARLIGAIYEACRIAGWDYEQQGALIKRRALAAGAESYFSHPLHENRHANDATMHGVFRIALENGAKWADMNDKSWEVDA